MNKAIHQFTRYLKRRYPNSSTAKHYRSDLLQFLALVKDERIDPSVSGRITEALGSLGDDRATAEGLAALLDREDIGSSVCEALFHVSRRVGMRVFARKGGGTRSVPSNEILSSYGAQNDRVDWVGSLAPCFAPASTVWRRVKAVHT